MTTISPMRCTATPVSTVLATIHEGWMEQVATFLKPALSEDADFWSRWAGARFVSDQFGDRFRLECALLDALGALVPEDQAYALAAARAGIERTAAALIASGRRRAPRVRTAQLARRLIDQLALWCVEVELATAQIETGELPPEASRLLSGLRVADALRK